MRCSSVLVLPWLAAAPLGCFPSLPACDTDCAATDGGDDFAPGTGTTTTLPAGSTGSDSTGGSEGSSSGSSDDGTDGTDSGDTGPISPGACEGSIAALSYDSEIVDSADFTLTFDPQAAYAPSELRIKDGSNADLIFTNAAQIEQHMGVLKFPGEASWQTSGPFMVLEDGPVVVRLSLGWTAATIQGTSIYTVIADGRIVRDELVNNSSTSGSFLTAYAALDPTRFDMVQWWGGQTGSIEVMPPPSTEPVYFLQAAPDDEVVACAHAEIGDAIGWASYADPSNLPVKPEHYAPGVRATMSQIGDASTFQLALQADWVRDAAVVPTDSAYYAHLLTVVGPTGPEGPCDCVAAHTAAYLSPTYLHPYLGGSPTSSLPGDQDGDAYNEAVGAHEINVDGAPPFRFDLRGGAEPPTMLLRLHGTSGVTGVSVGGTALAEGTDYLVQSSMAETDAQWVLIHGPFGSDMVDIDYLAD